MVEYHRRQALSSSEMENVTRTALASSRLQHLLEYIQVEWKVVYEASGTSSFKGKRMEQRGTINNKSTYLQFLRLTAARDMNLEFDALAT